MGNDINNKISFQQKPANKLPTHLFPLATTYGLPFGTTSRRTEQSKVLAALPTVETSTCSGTPRVHGGDFDLQQWMKEHRYGGSSLW
ncbi:hypothetical protein SUGI_0887180 [Cryptomeria japonica]|nr:hypothetical protein SUGI_0887180 [Cryptomeria japonica]